MAAYVPVWGPPPMPENPRFPDSVHPLKSPVSKLLLDRSSCALTVFESARQTATVIASPTTCLTLCRLNVITFYLLLLTVTNVNGRT